MSTAVRKTKAVRPSGRGVILLLAIAAGCVVANMYYAQPLLADIARSFHLSVAKIGSFAMVVQIGTVFGMLVFVPLGDSHERRALITFLLCSASASLALIAFATGPIWLCIAGFWVGATGATVHVIVPLAAHLAPEGKRGHTVGMIFSGMLLGILLARTASGFLGEYLGWRSVYWAASVVVLIAAVLVRTRLPESRPEHPLAWQELMRSILELTRRHAALRESALLGAAFFCAMSAFWTTLVFFLGTPPYHYGASAAGLFGLTGAAGAAGAPLVGKFSDSRGPRRTLLAALSLAIAACAVLALLGHHLSGLLAGAMLLDLGVQSGHVANQARIYGLAPEARSRLNTAYMVSFFTGGAIGSYCGAIAWKYFGWPGVCGFSVTVLAFGVAVWTAGQYSGETASDLKPGHGSGAVV